VKESVKDSLRDLESTAATSKTPSEFFENVQKTEFFENVKRNLVGSIPTFAAAEDGVILCWFSTATFDISYRFFHPSGGVT
jgi:hypothetical protein